MAATRRDELRSALARLGPWLRDEGVWHCLAFGTLLGAVRDGDVIEWDHDLDLFVRPADLGRIAAAAARTTDIMVWPRHLGERDGAVGRAARSAVTPVYQALGIAVGGRTVGELWAPVLFADGVLRLYDLATETYGWPWSSFPAFLAEELREVEIAGTPFPAFAHAEQALLWTYGEDWHTPRRAPADRGGGRAGHGYSGERTLAQLAEQIAWCEAQGWDRSRYAGQPSWPRPVAGGWPAMPYAGDEAPPAWTPERLVTLY